MLSPKPFWALTVLPLLANRCKFNMNMNFDNSIAGRIHYTLPKEVELRIFSRKALVSISAVICIFHIFNYFNKL
jgi:hypothetical protein